MTPEFIRVYINNKIHRTNKEKFRYIIEVEELTEVKTD